MFSVFVGCVLMLISLIWCWIGVVGFVDFRFDACLLFDLFAVVWFCVYCDCTFGFWVVDLRLACGWCFSTCWLCLIVMVCLLGGLLLGLTCMVWAGYSVW